MSSPPSANTNDNDEDATDGDPLCGYKLCGYLRALLFVSPLETLALNPGSPCFLSNVGFRSDSGILLLPIPNPKAKPNPDIDEVASPSPASSSKKKKKKRRSGLVLIDGSISVFHQLHALVSNGCLKIKARVLRVSVREENARAVVLVDVYLPMKVWTGWQFPPSSRGLVVSFFKHVR